ncbi:MAG: molybdenum cofactor guanylyltransferase [Duodenibacillus sp.]|nr:molybdenum cofactor guanylyltransferase [Duodenibacillus sp.]
MQVTAVVLAGGAARRMGGADKGLALFQGRPLIEHVLARIPAGVPVCICANRNLEAYRAYGHPVVEDAIKGYPGPLAGILAALDAAQTEAVAAMPCDSPFVPEDYIERLARAAEASGARCAAACAGGKRQPVFALVRRACAGDLRAFLAAGGRKVGQWLESQGCVWVEFESLEPFANFNTPEELAAGESARRAD